MLGKINKFLFSNSLSIFDGIVVLTVGMMAATSSLWWMLVLIPMTIASAILSKAFEG